VRDVFGERVLFANGGDADVAGFAGFGEGVVAAVKVFAFLRKRKRGVSDAVVDKEQREEGRRWGRGGEGTLSLFWSRSLRLGSLP
jgi:hypothetical protein